MTDAPFLRPLQPRDRRAVAEVFAAAYRLAFAELLGSLRISSEMVRREGWELLAVPRVGWAAWQPLVGGLQRLEGFALLDPERGELERLYVRPERQRRGIGSRLLAASETELWQDHPRIGLRVAADNPALAWYQDRGWQRDGRQDYRLSGPRRSALVPAWRLQRARP